MYTGLKMWSCTSPKNCMLQNVVLQAVHVGFGMLSLVTVINITNPSVSSLTRRWWTRQRSSPALRWLRSMWQDRVALGDDTPCSQHLHSCIVCHSSELHLSALWIEVSWSFQESSKEKKYGKCCEGSPDIGSIMLVKGSSSQYPNGKMESVPKGLLSMNFITEQGFYIGNTSMFIVI